MMEVLWFLLCTIGLLGFGFYLFLRGIGNFLLTLFGRKKND